MREPGPDHPITLGPYAGRVTVTIAGHRVAETERALILREAAYHPVLYIPREDVRFASFARSDHVTHCPYKGEASHFDLTIDGATRRAVAWSYEAPFPAVARIREHLAFYPQRVDSIETEPA